MTLQTMAPNSPDPEEALIFPSNLVPQMFGFQPQEFLVRFGLIFFGEVVDSHLTDVSHLQ